MKYKAFLFAAILLLPLCLSLFPALPAVAVDGSTQSISNPLGSSDPNVIIGKVINAVMGLVGSLALAMFVYGGLTWMTAAGNREAVQKGKDILIYAVLGLAVIFSAYAIVNFALKSIAGLN